MLTATDQKPQKIIKKVILSTTMSPECHRDADLCLFIFAVLLPNLSNVSSCSSGKILKQFFQCSSFQLSAI